MKNMVFLSQNVDGNIFTDYWKVLVLIFSGMENTVFFWVKKLIERWYLLVTEKFLFWNFRGWEIRSFFQPERWWKNDIYLVFLSFPWHSRTSEIWFFEQWNSNRLIKFKIWNYLKNWCLLYTFLRLLLTVINLTG